MTKRKTKAAPQEEAVWLHVPRELVPEGKTPYEVRNRKGVIENARLTDDLRISDGAWGEGTIFRSKQWIKQKLTTREANVIRKKIG